MRPLDAKISLDVQGDCGGMNNQRSGEVGGGAGDREGIGLAGLGLLGHTA